MGGEEKGTDCGWKGEGEEEGIGLMTSRRWWDRHVVSKERVVWDDSHVAHRFPHLKVSLAFVLPWLQCRRKPCVTGPIMIDF